MSYAAQLVAALENLCAALTAAGVKATTDRGRLQVPGAWVMPASAKVATLSGAGTVRVHVLLVTQDAGDAQSLKSLAGLLDLTLSVLDPDEDVDTSVVLPLPTGSTIPAFRVTVDLDL